eukprot:4056169-Alexandrium_andersonii.AAC.1
MCLAVQRAWNDPPVNNPPVHNQPGQRCVESMVLRSAAQPAAASGVVHDGSAIPSDGHPRARDRCAQQEFNRKGSSPRFGGQCAGAALNARGGGSRLVPLVAAAGPDGRTGPARIIELQRGSSPVEGDSDVGASVSTCRNVRGVLSDQFAAGGNRSCTA